ncbi:MAG: nitrilase-related carbon-nitrogen hydrolase [Kiritimatiellia bacterium]
MRIALTQMETVWEDLAANEAEVRRLTVRAKAAGAELVVFPEFTFVGFTPEPVRFCDTADAPRQLAFARALSQEQAIAIACGIVRAAEPLPRNNLSIVRHGETLLSYDKLHSYSFGGETRAYSRGDAIASAAFGGVTFGAFVCYDLRFPEIFQVAARTADAIVVIGNWPLDRIENWYTLLRARALETQCYVLGANRSGEGGGIAYGPSSVAFDPAGRRLTAPAADELLYCDVEPQVVQAVRAAFPLRSDRREDLYRSLLFRDPEDGTVG